MPNKALQHLSNEWVDTTILEYEFHGRDGYAVQLWAAYYDGQLFQIAYTSAPHWLVSEVEFPVPRRAT